MSELDLSKPFKIISTPKTGTSRVSPREQINRRTGAYDQETTTQEIAEGVASGLLAIPQGIAELGTSLYDYGFDTDYQRNVTSFFDGIRDAAGIDPEGTAGELAEIITQFAVPGLGAASAVSKLAKLRNLGTFTTRASQVGAAGIADFMVATDGTTTIGDFFEAGPTQTIDTIGLKGKERAAASILNRAKLASEAAGVAASVGPVLKTLGFAGDAAVKTYAPIVSPVARAVLKTGKALGQPIAKLSTEDSLVGNSLNTLFSVFRSRGNMTQEMFEVSSTINGKVESEINKAAITLRGLEKDIDKVLDSSEEVLLDGSPLSRASLNNLLYGYLTKESSFMKRAKELLDNGSITNEVQMLPSFMRSTAKKMRGQVDKLSSDIINSDFLSKTGSSKAIDAIIENIGSYLRRRYKIFEDKNFLTSDEFIQERTKTIEFFKNNPKIAEQMADELGLPRLTGDIEELATGTKVSDDFARRLTDEYVDKYATSGRKLPKQSDNVGRIAKNKIKTGLFATRQAVPEQLRRLLGEIKDPQEAFISTVADMAEFRAVDDFYKYINQNLVDGEGGLFLSKEAIAQLPRSVRGNYVELGEGFGSLQGVFAQRRVFNDLTSRVRGDAGTIGNIGKALYSGFLRAKGASQAAKTVYSPFTQVRNVTSASLFSTMQGNVGAGVNLFDSIGAVLGNIARRPDRAEYYQELQRLGVVGTQAQLKEIDRLLSEGLGGTRTAGIDDLGIPSSGSFTDTFKRGKISSFLSGVSRKTGLGSPKDYYQGGDDIWKIYNFEFEKNKLVKALGGVRQANEYVRSLGNPNITNLNQYAADIVKNTIPNYERVPEIIKGFRKLPLGNFIAFPAEILRTGANTLKRSLDELASSNPKVQEIGMRRLMGATATVAIAPGVIQTLALDLTDITKEQINALREVAPPWQRNSRLLPTTVENGKIKGYVDYSYTNPYDFLQRPFLAALNAASRGEEMGKDTDQIATDAMMGVVEEFFSPFTDESIISNRILDATTRGGVTPTGAKVYRKEDTIGDKVYKSIFHVADAFVPGALPIDLKAMKKETQRPGVELGRLPRALIGASGGDPKDPYGNERRLAQELFSAFTGIREQEVKPENILMYRGYEYSASIRNSSQIFNTAVSTRNQLDPDNAISTFIDANETRFRVMNDMHRVIENMRTLGLSNRQIKKALKENKVGNAEALLKGKFVPFEPSDEVIERVKKNGNRLPMRQIRSIIRQLKRRRLGEQQTPTTSNKSTPTTSPAIDFSKPFKVISSPSASVAEPIQSATPQAGATASIVPPNTQAQSAPVQPRDSSLLGGNPIDALKNQQIAQRLQGQ